MAKRGWGMQAQHKICKNGKAVYHRQAEKERVVKAEKWVPVSQRRPRPQDRSRQDYSSP